MLNKLIPNNKRGDIPIVVLVIGVIAICVLAIVSFSVVVFTLDNSFYGVSSMEKMSSLIEKYSFYKNLGMSDEEINVLDSSVDIKTGSKGESYIYVEEFALRKLSDVVFSVKYYLFN